MLFYSLDFAIFLPLVFLLYWGLAGRSSALQNVVLILASYFFYAYWDWRFLSLILISTIVDFSAGIFIENEDRASRRNVILCLSLAVNLGILFVFKYFNFFQTNFLLAFSFFGAKIPSNSLDLILPIGISFYTLQTISYTIDVYRKKIKPTKDLLAFSAYVCFFPQLLAGPIERATSLLPQLKVRRVFNHEQGADGLRQILWGLFKKVVIANNCAEYSNQIFDNSADMGGSALLLGIFFFSFQIYGDFSGYSDIAIGTARLFGIRLRQNFASPYFARDVAEFWRRWHISLSTWFRDYVYIPLGGSKVALGKWIRNIFLIFLISGLWHGANWTFLAWGLVNALLFLPCVLMQTNRRHLQIVAHGRNTPTLRELVSMMLTFGLISLTWVFFRSESITQAFSILYELFSASLFEVPQFYGRKKALACIFLIATFVLMEWKGRTSQYAIENLGSSWNRSFRFAFYYLLISCILWMAGTEQEFIYFQF